MATKLERHNLATAPLLIEPMVDIINTIMQFGALSTGTLREVKTIRRHSLARASDIHSGEWRESTDRTTESCCSRKRNQCQWRWWWALASKANTAKLYRKVSLTFCIHTDTQGTGNNRHTTSAQCVGECVGGSDTPLVVVPSSKVNGEHLCE